MPTGLRRFQKADALHFITFSCFHRLAFLEASGAKETVEAVLEQARQRHLGRVYGLRADARTRAPAGERAAADSAGNRLDIPPALHRCLATTNIIESPHVGVRIRTRRVTHWQNGKMVLRWMASAFLRTEKRFKRIMGHRDLWALEAILNPAASASQKAA